MSDYRRANFIPLTLGFDRLDEIRALYVDIAWVVPAVGKFDITDAWEANLPGIAFALYQDINFWWILGLYNGIIDPILDVSVGSVFRYAAKEDFIAYLESKKQTLLPES